MPKLELTYFDYERAEPARLALTKAISRYTDKLAGLYPSDPWQAALLPPVQLSELGAVSDQVGTKQLDTIQRPIT